jgi:hypothetical protein
VSLKRKVGAAVEEDEFLNLDFVFFDGGGNAGFKGIGPLVDVERNVSIFGSSLGLVFLDFSCFSFVFGGGSGANVALLFFVAAVLCDLGGGGNGTFRRLIFMIH